MTDTTTTAADELDGVMDELGRLFDAGDREVLLDAVRMALETTLRENRTQAQKIKELLKRVYGRSSERIDPNQLRLALAELRAEGGAEPEPDGEVPSDPPAPPQRSRHQQRRTGRGKLPAELPREEVRLVPTEEQVVGKGKMSKVGEERSEVLEYVPGHFKVIVYVRETWSNDLGEIVTAPAPNKIIEKGLPGPGLLAHVTVTKYKDHGPLARQARIMAREGVHIHRNTLVDWIAAVAFLLRPLAMRIYELAMLAHTLQVDDTHLKVRDSTKAKNIKRAHLWVLVGDHEYIAFRYTEDWTAERAKGFLVKRIGWMQVDGYGGYEQIANEGMALLVGCWMHCRRYWVKAFDAKDLRAAVPLKMIGRLYEIERESKDAAENHQQRYERRQRDMVPVLDELEEWIEDHRQTEPPKSLLGKALTYAHNHWEILRVVVNDGALELDNGDVERVIRGPAMGRRNWLFAGSDAGGERAAIILTVLETATRAGLDPRAYLHDVLVKLSEGWLMSRLDDLLPANWAAARAVAPAPDA